ncbi:hypothetical protein ADUPG1_001702, partial [Aduncisulcus paluster]
MVDSLVVNLSHGNLLINAGKCFSILTSTSITINVSEVSLSIPEEHQYLGIGISLGPVSSSVTTRVSKMRDELKRILSLSLTPIQKVLALNIHVLPSWTYHARLGWVRQKDLLYVDTL